MADDRKPFLTAEWRHLVMLNYPVELLEPLVPAGTTLDTYKGRASVTVFKGTKISGGPPA